MSDFNKNLRSDESESCAYRLASLIAMIYRGVQVVISLVTLALSIALVAEFNGANGRAIYIIVVSALTIIYIIPLFALSILNIYTPGILTLAEITIGTLWLIAFALITDDFGSLGDCYGSTSCRLGKSLIAFTLILWLSFVTSLFLLILLSIVPLIRTFSCLDCFKYQEFQRGGIVLSKTPDRFENFSGTENSPDLIPTAAAIAEQILPISHQSSVIFSEDEPNPKDPALRV